MKDEDFLEIWHIVKDHYRELSLQNGIPFSTLDDDMALSHKTADYTGDLAFVQQIRHIEGIDYVLVNIWRHRVTREGKDRYDEIVWLPRSMSGTRVQTTVFFPLRELRKNEDALSFLSSLIKQPQSIVEIGE